MKLSSGILILPIISLGSTAAKEKPNFVIILVDDLGWADLTCYNPGSFYDTPNIDRLAGNGVRFTQAYSAHPVCSPTRAALMTGKHPNRVNITDWIPGEQQKNRILLGPQMRNELPLEEITLAEKLKEQGYKTCFIGKWHLGGEGFYPENQGFDVNIGGHDKGSPPGGYYSPYKNPKLKDGPDGEYLPDRLTSESIRFIEENSDIPFLLYLSFYTVHTPIQASKKHIDKYREKLNTNPPGIVISPSGNSKKTDSSANEDSDESFLREGEVWTRLVQNNADYASMVAAMDENVGWLMDVLYKKGLGKNTWIFFTSDNGGLSTLTRKGAPTCNLPLRAGKGWCYEGGIRVAFIVSGPGVINPGRTENQPVVSMDIFPTIVSLVDSRQGKTDGKNLLPILTRGKKISRDELFWHYPHYHGSGWRPGSALRKGDWKLVYYYEDNRAELYNLADDPYETQDLASGLPVQTEKLKKLMMKRLKDTEARFPAPNPLYGQEATPY